MNLSETKEISKKFLFIAVLMTFMYYVGLIIYKVIKTIGTGNNPPPPPPAAFGKLERLEMQTIKINEGIEYVLDTKTGGLPEFPDRLTVYKFVQPTPNLLSEQQTKALALELGFKQSPTKTSNSDFRWVDGTNKRQMDANIVTKNFKSTTDIDKLGSYLSVIPSIKESDGVETVKNFISSQGLVDKRDLEAMEYSTVPTIINFGQYKDTFLFPSNAKMIKVNANRHLITKKQQGNDLINDKNYKILGPDPKNSKISIFVTNSKDVFKLPQIDFNYQRISYEEASDYPLAPVSAVWPAVSQGKGIISYAKLKSQDYYAINSSLQVQKIYIRDIYLAYYEPEKVATYMQPIYVFEGVFTTPSTSGTLSQEGEIIIYFPAVSGEFVN